MIEDRKLSEHFSLYELTHTDHAEFLAMNRQVTEDQIAKLIQVANLYEVVRLITDCPWIIPSAYRCPALNAAIGSTPRSQHLLCEAGDGVPKGGLSVPDAFKRLRAAAKDGKIKFGQMIYEKANRNYSGGVVEWIHLSLGFPYRQIDRCGQILTMVDGSYQLLETVPQK